MSIFDSECCPIGNCFAPRFIYLFLLCFERDSCSLSLKRTEQKLLRNSIKLLGTYMPCYVNIGNICLEKMTDRM